MSYRKGKFYPRTNHEYPEEECRCSSTLSLTSALDGVDVQRHALAALLPGKRPVPISWEAGWAPVPFWPGKEKIIINCKVNWGKCKFGASGIYAWYLV